MKAEQARQLAVESRPEYEDRLKAEVIDEIEKEAKKGNYAVIVDVGTLDEMFMTGYLTGLGYRVMNVGCREVAMVRLQVNW